jgi:hypothetical protein
MNIDIGTLDVADVQRLRDAVQFTIDCGVVTASYTEYSALLSWLDYRILTADRELAHG